DFGAGGSAFRRELVGLLLRICLARDRRLDRELGLARLSDLAIGGDLAAPMPFLPQHLADDEPRAQHLQQRQVLAARRRFPRRDLDANLRHTAGAAIDGDGRLARAPCSRRGRGTAFEAERDALLELRARLQLIRPGQPDRTDIGLEGRIAPVALILHLESVAVEPGSDKTAGREFVLQRAYVEERLIRADPARELGALV